MNIFRFLGDLCHLASIIILIQKMRVSKSCQGISFKSQLLFMIIYCCRYVDLFYSYVSFYNSTMKALFLASQYYILYLMKQKFRPTIDMKIDRFRIEFLLGSAAIISLLTTTKYTFTEIFWTFSIWLESVAILPQLLMLQRTGEGETLTVHYLFALGLYRLLYIPNWVYRYFIEGRSSAVASVAGIIQSVLYADFFVVYYQTVMKGQKFELPS